QRRGDQDAQSAAGAMTSASRERRWGRDRLPGPSIRAIYITKAIAIGAILVMFWLTKLFVFPGRAAGGAGHGDHSSRPDSHDRGDCVAG
ncbi:MAG TPA: hypothetical protein VN812_03030, partial [Candidatus Acidoferrales bacterium]|nr:hypothetical protein [Candidatus Acidoferrales bacterium]